MSIDNLGFKGGLLGQIRQEIETEREIENRLPRYRRDLERIINTTDKCKKLTCVLPSNQERNINSLFDNNLLSTSRMIQAEGLMGSIMDTVWSIVPREVNIIRCGASSFKRDAGIEIEKSPVEWGLETVRDHCQQILENLPKRRFFF
jgi:hypothetical protein